MSIRYKFFLAFSVLVVLACSVAFPASGESQGQEILPCACTTDR